jgi:hypothetical protein
VLAVSIHAHPKVRRYVSPDYHRPYVGVSIHIRVEDWATRLVARIAVDKRTFQSTPDPKGRATRPRQSQASTATRFNPHRPEGRVTLAWAALVASALEVSIHTRSEGRATPPGLDPGQLRCEVDSKAGRHLDRRGLDRRGNGGALQVSIRARLKGRATRGRVAKAMASRWFQSTPDSKAGRHLYSIDDGVV